VTVLWRNELTFVSETPAYVTDETVLVPPKL
jgi:hypothetical protein